MQLLDKIALRNLGESRSRTLLLASAVALGVAVVSATGVFSAGTRAGLEASGSKVTFLTTMSDMIFNIVGSIIILAAGFLVFNAFTITVAQRQQQIGMLRALGTSRRQVLNLVLREALFTGGLGTGIGLLLGPWLGRGMLAVVSAYGLEVGQGRVAPYSLILALVTGLGVTFLAALLPARRAARLSPMLAIGDQSLAGAEPVAAYRTSRLGLLLAIGLWGWLLIAPPGEWSAYHPPWEMILLIGGWLTWMLAVLLLIPSATRLAVGLCSRILYRLGGSLARLVSDNLQRSLGRVTVIANTFTIGLMVLLGIGGQVYFNNHMVEIRAAEALREAAWAITPNDIFAGLGQSSAFNENAGLEASVMQAVQELAEGRAEVTYSYNVVAPEISTLPGFPSFMPSESEVDRWSRPGVFELVEGDWGSAAPLLKGPGCAILLGPSLASRYALKPGDSLSITGREGKVDCVLAAIGMTGFAPSSIIGPGGRALFLSPDDPPDLLAVRPLTVVDYESLGKDLYELAARYPGRMFVTRADEQLRGITSVSDQMMTIFNGMIFLALLSAALGMANVVIVSVLERQRELGLLRAVGATRRQVTRIVAGEAALVGILGALLGGLAGLGMAMSGALTFGAVTFGLVDANLRLEAFRLIGPTLQSGWWALLAAPLLAFLVAYPTARRVVRGAVIEALDPERRAQPSARRGVPIWGRGSLRTRFVLGTGLLLGVVLFGLVMVVTLHTRLRLEQQLQDGMNQVTAWSASLIESGVPSGVDNLSLALLRAADQPLNLSADSLLRMQSLMREMTQSGSVQVTVTDRFNVVLLSLDERQVGQTLPPLDTYEVAARSQRSQGDWRILTSAPIHNDAGAIIGSLRLESSAEALSALLARLRNTLLGIGGFIVALGMLIGAGLSAPLARTAHSLAAHAAEVSQGRYSLFSNPTKAERKNWSMRWPVQTRLTLCLVGLVILMVGILELIVIPIQQRFVEDMYRDTLQAGIAWVGRAASTSLSLEAEPTGRPLALESLAQEAPALDLARLQKMTEQARSLQAVYTALVDMDGWIVLSDRVELIGEQTRVLTSTQVTREPWHEQSVWVVSTPIQNEEGQIGMFRMAVSPSTMEAFLEESRALFNLIGLIAVLAGVLLAQAVGGVVSAPVRSLAAGARKVAQGDLSTRFEVHTQDELSILAAAYNQMVAGLQEREWLRDMFGRFVSQEVAEAIRSGQVRLEGENRVVSVLFCDIRDFTTRSEQHTPAEMVALLNDYLPLVVEAAEHHGGMVNKFGGDSALIIYGAPGILEASAYSAVLTALEIRAGLEQLNVRLAERGEAPVQIGVGINTGTVLAGAIGPRQRQEYTVIGDTVNLASRIEALNKQYPEHGILISAWTYEALGARREEFKLQSLGRLEIRGKLEPVEVWAVAG